MSQTPQPWTVRSSKTVLKDRWLDLRADDCVSASGHELNPYYVLRYPDWVNIAAITEAGKVVMIRHYRHGVGETVLEMPGGMMDPGEDPAAAALRELAEETGYVAEQAQFVCALPANPATHTNRIHTFVARHARKLAQPDRGAGEDLSVEEIAPADLLRMLRNSEFGQSMQAGPMLLALEVAGSLKITL